MGGHHRHVRLLKVVIRNQTLNSHITGPKQNQAVIGCDEFLHLLASLNSYDSVFLLNQKSSRFLLVAQNKKWSKNFDEKLHRRGILISKIFM